MVRLKEFAQKDNGVSNIGIAVVIPVIILGMVSFTGALWPIQTIDHVLVAGVFSAVGPVFEEWFNVDLPLFRIQQLVPTDKEAGSTYSSITLGHNISWTKAASRRAMFFSRGFSTANGGYHDTPSGLAGNNFATTESTARS